MGHAGLVVGATSASRSCSASRLSRPFRARRRLRSLRADVRRVGERSFGLGHLQDLLLEVRHRGFGIGLVEGDHVGERADDDGAGAPGEVAVQVVLEVVEQHLVLVGAVAVFERQRERVDDRGAGGLEVGHGAAGEAAGVGGEAEVVAEHADAGAFQRVRREVDRVVGGVPGGARGGGVGGVGAGHSGEQERGVQDGARHRAGGVLAVRKRDDAGPADEPDGRLDAHEAVHGRRAHHRAVGLGAHAHGGEARGDGGAGAGRRAARRAVERVRVPRLPADAAPAGRRARGAEVGPLAEVRLAEDHGAGLAELRDQRRISSGDVLGERERAGGRGHGAGGLDVVL